MVEETVPQQGEEKILNQQQQDAESPKEQDDPAQAKIAELEESVNQYKDQLLRKAAEFENYKRRTENDLASMVRFSTEELITKLLPVLDDFERSLKMSKERGGPSENGNDESGFIRGVELIYAKFKKLLETHGVKEMNVIDQPFDPNLHDALLQMPKEGVPPHTVIEQVDKGYMLHDKVIRHARVIVSADQSGETDGNGGGAVSKFPGDDANKNETMN
jgi:molecular chaperone GrpE